MVLLVDTNVILDCLTLREPFEIESGLILQYCGEGKITGCIAAHSITNSFYILRKMFTAAERKRLLFELCRFMEIANVEKSHVLNALKNENFDDFEDCVQMECAKAAGAEYIVTRDPGDYVNSDIPAISPRELLSFLGDPYKGAS
ncbi:MAG: PIN domain-containing protein [Treponema sp.]|jgi:predicted nucleic acid-binding protein|nr:PIN domain-containing protein [Treponema sp.]